MPRRNPSGSNPASKCRVLRRARKGRSLLRQPRRSWSTARPRSSSPSRPRAVTKRTDSVAIGRAPPSTSVVRRPGLRCALPAWNPCPPRHTWRPRRPDRRAIERSAGGSLPRPHWSSPWEPGSRPVAAIAPRILRYRRQRQAGQRSSSTRRSLRDRSPHAHRRSRRALPRQRPSRRNHRPRLMYRS